MCRICAVLFFCLFVSGCGLKVERPKEILVTDITMPSDGEFAPGDRVTVSASGFESGDEIWFEIAWTGGSEEFAPEGWAKGIRGFVTERTAQSITFLAPGHYPPSTVSVQLFRRGIVQTLGTIRVSDGVQHETFLYTLTPTAAGGTSVARCPMYGSADMREEVLTSDLALDYAVGNIGSGMACGMAEEGLVELDLITHHTQESRDGALLAGSLSASTVVVLYSRNDRLYLSGGTSQPCSWQLPEGVTVDRIVRQPFACAFNALLLTVRNDNDTFSPLVLPLAGSTARLGEAVASEYLRPYWTLKPSADDPARMERVGGYAVLHGSLTWFLPLDPATLALKPQEEHDLAVEGRVLSMAQCIVAGENSTGAVSIKISAAGKEAAGEPLPEVRIGVLTEVEGRREAWVYNPATQSGAGVLSEADLSDVTGIFFAR